MKRTIDDTKTMEMKDEHDIADMPQKKFYRTRAHCNPLSFNDAFEYPVAMDWGEHYPDPNAVVRHVDVSSSWTAL